MRQELEGTCVYLDILQRTTSELETSQESTVANSNEDEQLDRVAEEKLVSFCGQVLKEASELQSVVGGTNNMEIHRVLELRSPIIVKVWSLIWFD